jgi:hypothetical protein
VAECFGDLFNGGTSLTGRVGKGASQIMRTNVKQIVGFEEPSKASSKVCGPDWSSEAVSEYVWFFGPRCRAFESVTCLLGFDPFEGTFKISAEGKGATTGK